LVLGRSAPAAAEDGIPLVLGQKNAAFNETSLEKQAGPAGSPIASPAFTALQGVSAARLGNAPVDTSKFPVGTGGMPLSMAAVAGESVGNIGVFGNAGPRGVGMWGASEGFVGTWGVSLTGVGVLGQTYPTGAGHEKPYPAAGVLGVGGQAPGTWGLSTSGPGAWGQSNTGPGVLGQTGIMTTGALGLQTGYPAAGVYGVGGDAVGVWGVANRGVGSWGQSNTGPGVLGQTGVSQDPGPIQYPPSGVLGIGNTANSSGVIGWIGTPAAGASYPRAAVLGVGNQGGTGTWGVANGGGIGAWGQSNDGIGVSGESANRIGAWFKVGNVTIDPKTLESAAVHTTAMGTHVSMCARSQQGVAFMAEVSDPKGTGLMIETPEGGVAIMAMGRLQSDQIMLADVGKAVDMVSIPCNEINAMSHVSIMLRNDIGAAVTFVELQPGVGIVVHFDRRTRNAGTLTYAVTEMMGTHQ
jgi:hypothetical protein